MRLKAQQQRREAGSSQLEQWLATKRSSLQLERKRHRLQQQRSVELASALPPPQAVIDMVVGEWHKGKVRQEREQALRQRSRLGSSRSLGFGATI